AVRRGARAGSVSRSIEPGGPPVLTSYRTAGGTPPLITAVSLSEDEIFADWREQVRTSIAAFSALMLSLLLMMAVLFRQMDARTRVEQVLGENQRLEAERLRGTNERLEEALEREQRARRETEAASYLKDEFLMTVSHELRTPLTAIYGWVRMLGGREMSAQQRGRALAALERNARAQTRLIDDLLDVSRAISGKLRLDARPVNLADLLLAAVDVLGPALAAKSLRLETDLDSGLPPVVADADRVQQIVWNLLSNAIKFTPDGGWVRLALRRIDGQVEIAVSDSGVGIDPAFLPHVFERFRQAEAGSRRRYGGLGLGLAIVRHLAELHGGTASAESDGEGRGATFRVRLPLRAAHADADVIPPQPARASPAAAMTRLDGVRVLVVDDEADSRELFTSILESVGAEVLNASSAAGARSILKTEAIDVLLSDIEMPGEDGYELLQRAAAEGGARPPALAVTAYARAIDRRRALDAGFDWHLAKPVEPTDLIGAVASLARRSTDQFRRV
ncbi:MAG TPA: ATP-binding protein, partial [Vicinamibacterales bacterium]|nr:ATP-binding protein [Vicinamibacterales bacterium]